MSPGYVFRVDEIREADDAPAHADRNNWWIPSTDAHANVRIGQGATGIYWVCDGQQIYQGNGLPAECQKYSTFSVYYHQGFWVLEGDATQPNPNHAWTRLNFDHEHDYTSFLSHAGQRATLAVQRPDQRWPAMLLPDIYHTPTQTPYPQYGGLVGELPIFLALMAFSVSQAAVPWVFQTQFMNGRWLEHNQQHGRIGYRGVVVDVWTYGGSTRDELRQFEHGNLGKYFH